MTIKCKLSEPRSPEPVLFQKMNIDNISHRFVEDIHMGNCYRVYCGKDLIAVVETQLAATLLIECLATTLPITCNNKEWTIELASIEGIGF